MPDSYKPNKGMQIEAERAIKWKEEGRPGGTRIGLIRARQIMRGENLSRDTVMRMHSFFSRHEVDKKAEGFEPGEDGYPSAGRVAWGLWGGDAGYSWSQKLRNSIVKEEQERGINMEILTREGSLAKRDYDDEYEYDLEESEYQVENDIWNVVVSTPEIDRYGTIIVPSGIDYTAYMKNPIVLAQHQSDKWPVGRCLGFFLNGENLEATMQIECITDNGKSLNSLINAGYVKAVSVGIIPIEKEEQTINGEKVTVFTKSELVEFSIVSVPANRNALIKRSMKEAIAQTIQKYKEVERMLTPEIEQKIKEELLPAIEEAVTAELTNLGFSEEEATSAVGQMLSIGVEALIASLRGGESLPDEQVTELVQSEPVVEAAMEGEEEVAEDDAEEMTDEEEVKASFEAAEVRVGKKIAANTEMKIYEGLQMIKQGYKVINEVTRGSKVSQSVPTSKKQRAYNVELNKPVQKTTKELLELI